METLSLIIIIIFVSFVAGVYKVDEAQEKHVLREAHGSDFSFLSTKGYMQLVFFLIVSPLLLYVDWSVAVFLLVLGLSLLRFVPWVVVNVFKGRYKDTKHQASTNFTMLENFAGPLGALLVYGLFNYFTNSNAPILWYILTPLIGIFLLWALRAKESKLSKEMIQIISLQAVLVATETVIIFYLQQKTIDFVTVPSLLSSWVFVDNGMIVFLIVIAISSLLSALYFVKDIIYDTKKGVGLQAFRIGFISAVHDVVYFVSFMYFGPIFIIARRGLLIPMQNLYLNLKDGHKLSYLITRPFKEPLLTLNGGKDFIISFVDFIFNRVSKMIILLLG